MGVSGWRADRVVPQQGRQRRIAATLVVDEHAASLAFVEGQAGPAPCSAAVQRELKSR
jgi:hypothetical protein